MTGRKRGPRRTSERLRRLLVMLPWLAERGSVATVEMAERFGVSVAELVADLELAAMCGLPPYLDEVLDIIVDEDEVRLGVPRLFTRPLRLNAAEAFGLVAAVRGTAALPGAEAQGALATAVEKLAALVPAEHVDVDLRTPPATEDLSRAAASGTVVRATYWSASAQRTTDRVLEPLQVFSDRGQWYVWAVDRTRAERRIFRLDRFEQWALTDERFEVTDPGPVPAWFEGAEEALTVTLRLDQSVAWLLDSVAAQQVRRHPDGTVEADLVVVDEPWLERLMLRLGPSAVVVAPPAMTEVGRRLARRLLERYAASS